MGHGAVRAGATFFSHRQTPLLSALNIEIWGGGGSYAGGPFCGGGDVFFARDGPQVGAFVVAFASLLSKVCVCERETECVFAYV